MYSFSLMKFELPVRQLICPLAALEGSGGGDRDPSFGGKRFPLSATLSAPQTGKPHTAGG